MAELDPVDPIAEFQTLFARVSQDAPTDPTAMALATADATGAPSARMVLLKGVDARGFQFFTNYESRKGRELAENPRAALCWHWAWLEMQVRAEGTIERLGAEESDAYFATRPRGSQLGAWASFQSQPLDSRFALLRRVVATEARFLGRPIPRPPHWGGYLLRPQAIEFWQGKTSRLHERRRFTLDSGSWRYERLSP
uniref:Pyridoxamine 5'-phosphate oxidase n=1 Tax=uncultured bacterium A1Q1_fos_517 TaxID=1256582 RepID=L7VWX0_9BACT|nr:pyridoxamine 5'-phosphate oxidase [uncultured bacterium A1Q1_fos_517]